MKFKIVHEQFKLNSHTELASVEALKRLTVARNQTVSFQILLNPKVRSVINISSEMALTDEIDLKRYRVQITSKHPHLMFNVLTLPDKEGVEYADILTHQAFVKHDAHMPAAVWVDINLDENHIQKEETITVEIFESTQMQDEKCVFKEDIVLDILDISIPKIEDTSIYMDLWQHNSNIARLYEVPLWSDKHFELIENTVKTLADLGQKSVMLIGSETPWNGWGSHIMSKDGTILYEHSIIMCSKEKNGKLKTDFTHMQRYIDLCAKYGIDGDYSLYGLLGVWNLPLFPGFEVEDYPETLMIRYYDEKNHTYNFLKDKESVIEYITQIIDYFKETDQLDKLRIAADEPKKEPALQEKYDASLKILRDIEPNLKFKLAIDKDEVIEKYNDITEDIATSFPCTTRFYDKIDDSKRKLWYICNIPDKPNTFLHSPLYEARLLGVMNMLFNYDGILRWAYTCWTKNPRENISYAPQGFPVGDLVLVYPEANGEIALSLRYKALQRGIEDYEILKKIDDEQVNKKVYEILKLNTNPKSYMRASKLTHDDIYSTDIQDYENMRVYLLEKYKEL